MKNKYVLAWGGGVNSTAIIAMVRLGMLPEITKDNTHIVFADTGAEMPYTYEHTSKTVIPMVKEGWIVKALNSDKDSAYYAPRCKKVTLYQYCINNNVLPSRLHRWCTSEYKRLPIQRYAKEQNLDITILGISTEEAHRAKARYSQNTFYPLLEHNIDRNKCIELTKRAKLPETQKSGCYFCPYQRKDSWITLYKEYPELFKKVTILEDNARKKYDGKKYFLRGKLLIKKQVKKWLSTECGQQVFKELGLEQHCFCSD